MEWRTWSSRVFVSRAPTHSHAQTCLALGLKVDDRSLAARQYIIDRLRFRKHRMRPSDKSILMENVKPFELQCTKHVTLALLKSEIEASCVLKKYISECIYVYIYTA